MNKKLLLLGVYFIISTFYANAQEYTFGIKAGVNYNSIGVLKHLGTSDGGGSNVTPLETTYYKADKAIGTQFGIFGMIAFKKFFIRPEIMFISLKNSYPLALKTSNWTSSTVEIPILFGYEIYKPISVYAGPAFSSIKDMKLEGVETPILFKKSAVNLNAGIMINLSRFGIDFRYSYGMSSIAEQRVDIVRSIYGTNVGRLLEYSPSQIMISVHINLIKINGYETRKRVKKGWRPDKCSK